MLLEALLHLKGKLELELLLVGTRKGRWTRPLRSLAQQLRVRSLIRFEGPFQAPELRQYLSRAHIGVAPLPSDPRNTVQGCCPIKLVEFMAAGLPILSTRLPVVEELVEHQRSAWLVRPNSPYALAQGILKLADDPALRQSLGQAAQQRAREQLHRSHFETSLAQILAQLTGGG
jgi:glycosyltransferase involved in cell wall biosynthesis